MEMITGTEHEIDAIREIDISEIGTVRISKMDLINDLAACRARATWVSGHSDP
jgi:hypothetical protein